MNRQKALEIGYCQLAVDFNTTPEVFRRRGVFFTAPARKPDRRAYSTEMPFFEMVTVGSSAVIMAEERLCPALKEWSGGAEEPHWLFEFPRMQKLAEILAPYGYELTQTHHGYLPAGSFSFAPLPEGFSLKWLEQREIAGFYPNKAYPNALQERENPARPDVLALAAMDGEKIAGLAGASADGKELWQIGIDVLPEYRGRGLGTALVRNLAAEIERRGKLPFYYASLSNLHSQNIAVACGFRPAWVDVSAWKRED